MSSTFADDPIVTDHALGQWDERSPDDSVAPETAWQQAQKVVPRAGAFYEVDEVRHHRASGTLLLRRGLVLKTVYTTDDLSDEVYHAVKHAIPEERVQA